MWLFKTTKHLLCAVWLAIYSLTLDVDSFAHVQFQNWFVVVVVVLQLARNVILCY